MAWLGMGLISPNVSQVERQAIRSQKIESARQCQLGRRFRPPKTLPSSWHSHFYQKLLIILWFGGVCKSALIPLHEAQIP